MRSQKKQYRSGPRQIKLFAVVLSCACLIFACSRDYLVLPPVPQPKVPVATETLEAAFVRTAPTTVNSPYWRNADFLPVELADLSTMQLYTATGLFNMTGTYNGLMQFNGGDTIDLILKAAYDDSLIYILAEWTDENLDASLRSWLWDWHDDPLNPGDTSGWTSQRNSDRLAFAFDIDGASGDAGTFASVGCAASCHGGSMQPTNGSIDIWSWSLALSEPLGHAADMNTSQSNGLVYDNGGEMATRNVAGADDRSGPMYEWDGTEQSVEKWDGSTAILDPGFFLLNKTNFTGDPGAGDHLYIEKCGETCHGVHGEGYGPDLDGTPFNKPGVMNRFSRETFDDFASSFEHSGQTTYNELSAQEIENVIARVRGFTGVPGYYLNKPTGSGADVKSSANILTAKVQRNGNRYRVLLVRELNTGNSDDATFNPDGSGDVTFGVALMDNDGKNHIGANQLTLTFIPR